MRIVHTRPRRRRARGFTLPELMAVVAIVGVMGAVAMATLNGATSSNNSAALARSLHFAMMNARSAALSDGYQRRLNCTLAASAFNSFCTVDKLCLPGMSPNTTSCTTVWTPQSRINCGSHATIWNVTNATEPGTGTQGGAQVVGSKTVLFYPDGSSDTTGKTIYVGDTKATNAANQFKIYVYSATGMARLVNQW
jgi:prepilin-type N-terminal cleavage/methylation domain-containing protein